MHKLLHFALLMQTIFNSHVHNKWGVCIRSRLVCLLTIVSPVDHSRSHCNERGCSALQPGPSGLEMHKEIRLLRYECHLCTFSGPRQHLWRVSGVEQQGMQLVRWLPALCRRAAWWHGALSVHVSLITRIKIRMLQPASSSCNSIDYILLNNSWQ